MTELQKLYERLRPAHRGHRGTLLAMWKLTGVDPESIDRELLRARRADQIDAKRAKRDARMVAA